MAAEGASSTQAQRLVAAFGLMQTWTTAHPVQNKRQHHCVSFVPTFEPGSFMSFLCVLYTGGGGDLAGAKLTVRLALGQGSTRNLKGLNGLGQ